MSHVSLIGAIRESTDEPGMGAFPAFRLAQDVPGSCQAAVDALEVLAGATVTVKPLQRITSQIGADRQQELTEPVAEFQALTLAERTAPHPTAAAPELGVVLMDGSRMQRRDLFTPRRTRSTPPPARGRMHPGYSAGRSLRALRKRLTSAGIGPLRLGGRGSRLPCGRRSSPMARVSTGPSTAGTSAR